MTNLSPTQIALLDAVAEAKASTDAELEELEHWYKARQWELQLPLRIKVGEAADHGVPWRRLQEPLETSDHKTVKGFYPTPDDVREWTKQQEVEVED